MMSTIEPLSKKLCLKLNGENETGLDANEKQQQQQHHFDQAIEWILSNGGYVHEAISMSIPINNGIENSVDSLDAISRGQVITESHIKKGTLLIHIPKKCLISMGSINKSKLGKQVLNSIYAVKESDSEKFYHSKSDIVIAIYLALLIMENQTKDNSLEDKTNKDDKKISFDEDTLFFSPYINTLPQASCYDNLPRRWTEVELKEYLGGTSLIKKVLKDKKGILKDYELVYKSLGKRENDSFPLPSLELFDSCLAAVSSRAFAEFGGVNTVHFENDILEEKEFYCSQDAMVPMLDLLDHKRGSQQTPEVHYECVDGDIFVKARIDISENTIIRDTYGAKGNAQLLRRYGFCLPNNLEPDGSSNDILELDVSSLLALVIPISPVSSDENRSTTSNKLEAGSEEVIDLRAGPKSYTYGGFVKALEKCLRFVDDQNNTESNAPARDKFDDIDSFLNECEEDEEDDFEWDRNDEDGEGFDNFYAADSIGGEGSDDYFQSGNNPSNLVNNQNEYKALCALKNALEYATKVYVLAGSSLDSSSSEKQKMATLLVLSEKRTISLYLYAIDMILNDMNQHEKDKTKLSNINNNDATNHCSSESPMDAQTSEDNRMIRTQAEELKKVYLQIRHPQIFATLRN